MRAFVFDDEPDLRSLIRIILEKRGHEVATFPHPVLCKSCLCVKGHRCADAIISDISMPRETGINFIENQKLTGCKIQNLALMSGQWSEDDMQCARVLDCKIFRKPLKMDEFIAWLDRCQRSVYPKRVLESYFQNSTEHED